MAAYLILTYDIVDRDRFKEYNPGSLAEVGKTIANHGGEVVIADKPEMITGEQRHTVIGLKFPDRDAAKAWLDDPEYAPYKAIRLESTDNITTVLADEFG